MAAADVLVEEAGAHLARPIDLLGQRPDLPDLFLLTRLTRPRSVAGEVKPRRTCLAYGREDLPCLRRTVEGDEQHSGRDEAHAAAPSRTSAATGAAFSSVAQTLRHSTDSAGVNSASRNRSHS